MFKQRKLKFKMWKQKFTKFKSPCKDLNQQFNLSRQKLRNSTTKEDVLRKKLNELGSPSKNSLLIYF